jgi:hypothetical protein
MSHRCCIGIVQADESIRAIYCNNAGYLDGVGKILHTHYTNKAQTKRKKLIQLGDISSLGISPATGDTVAYRRDRQEKNTRAISYFSFQEYVKETETGHGFEYWYLWSNNEWLVSQNPVFGFQSLLHELVTEKLAS